LSVNFSFLVPEAQKSCSISETSSVIGIIAKPVHSGKYFLNELDLNGTAIADPGGVVAESFFSPK
jgi:hypothetical protein